MSVLAPTLESCFTDRLVDQRHASLNTVSAYRDAWRLLLRFAQLRAGIQPCRLDLADLDAAFISGFLNYLEQQRRNSVRTRNARLAAIRSFFRYAALRHPEHAQLIARVLAIPTKRGDRTELAYLDQPEVDALLAAPDRRTWTGRRDHALLDLAVDTGLRVSELTGLRNSDAVLGTGAHLNCTGKGRKRRCTPLRKQTAAVLRVWMKERAGAPDDPLFPTRRGSRVARSRVTPRHQTRPNRRATLPIAQQQAHHATHPAAHVRHVPARPRRGHHRDRTMARPRARRDNANLRTRRHVHQRTSPGPHNAARHNARTLPAARRAARVPRRALIVPRHPKRERREQYHDACITRQDA